MFETVQNRKKKFAFCNVKISMQFGLISSSFASPCFCCSSCLQISSEKRPSAEMMKPKPKPQKKKKKKDPNEPQKPVSAYALFFRDTQAAIKGQNPNATFGDVSKIVASMWDSLGEEQKQVENQRNSRMRYFATAHFTTRKK